jgi:hypothetical protein
MDHPYDGPMLAHLVSWAVAEDGDMAVWSVVDYRPVRYGITKLLASFDRVLMIWFR